MSIILGVPDLIAAFGKRQRRRCSECLGFTLYTIPVKGGEFSACSYCDTTPEERKRLGIPTASMA